MAANLSQTVLGAAFPPLPHQPRARLIQSLINHDALYKDVDDNHPEGDVRQRFLGARKLRSDYFEGLVDEIGEEINSFHEDCRRGRKDLESEDVQNEYHELMMRSAGIFTLNSQANEQDSRAAQGPLVDPHFMKIFRYNLASPQTGPFAPNGKPKTFYGSHGEPVDPRFTSLRDCESDILGRLIIDKLSEPFYWRVFVPARRLCRRMLRRPLHREEDVDGFKSETLEKIVIAAESMFAVASFAGTVVLVRTLDSWKYSLIATTSFNFLVLGALCFLSKEAVKLFTFTAGYWAVMVVFIAANEYGSKEGKGN